MSTPSNKEKLEQAIQLLGEIADAMDNTVSTCEHCKRPSKRNLKEARLYEALNGTIEKLSRIRVTYESNLTKEAQ